MSGDRERALRTDGINDFEDVAVGGNVLAYAQADDVGRAMIRERVFRDLEAGDDDHSVLVPRSPRFGPNDFEVERKGRLGERVVEVLGRAAEESLVLADVVGDCDRAETPAPVEINEFGNIHLAVAEGRVRMHVCKHHESSMQDVLTCFSQDSVRG